MYVGELNHELIKDKSRQGRAQGGVKECTPLSQYTIVYSITGL